VISTSSLTYPGSASVAVDASGEHAIVGGSDGIAGIYSLPDDKILTVLKVGGGAITDAVWYGSQPVVATSSGAIKIFEDGNEATAFTSHAGAVNALAMHPSGEILASVGADKSFVFYDLVGKKPATQVYTECSTYQFTSTKALTNTD
jgi:pre-mRNA-processing factor 19